MRRRLERNLNDAEITEYCRRRLDELDGLIAYEGPEDPECRELGTVRKVEPEVPGERKMLLKLMDRHRPMSDFGAANFARTLVSVTGRAADLLGDEAEAQAALRVEVCGVSDDEAQDMMG